MTLKKLLGVVVMALGMLGVASAQQIVGLANGTAQITGVVPGSTINIQNSGATSVVLTTNTSGSPASFSVEIDGSASNGASGTYSICGSANTTNTLTTITCSTPNGTYDHVQVNITLLSPDSNVYWALQAIYPISVTATISGTVNANFDEINGVSPVTTSTGSSNSGTQRVTTSTDSTIGTVTTITNTVKVVGPTASGQSATLNPVMVAGENKDTGLIETLATDPAGDMILGYSSGTARANNSFTPVFSSAAESNHVFSTFSGATLYRMYITTGAVAGYLMIFNTTSAPADGAVTPRDCVAVAANSTVSFSQGNWSEYFNTGITAVFSTTGCFTKTASATAFFSGQGVF